MTLTLHTLAKNEERFVWYSVMSVIDHVDKVLLWDTGSTDGTLKIIEEIKRLYPEKVDLKLLSDITPEEFPKIRQQMLDATKTDWFIVVDADEIWFEKSIQAVVGKMQSSKDVESIVVPTINLVGDMFHFQEEKAGQYELAGKKGHYSLRGVKRKIPGLTSSNPHGTWGWTDGTKMIQDRDPNKIKFVDAPYLHVTFLPRSKGRDKLVPKRVKKLKHEIGISFPLDFYYPEVFFKHVGSRPGLVPSPWEVANTKYKLRAAVETPLRKIKRRVLPSKVGY